MIDPNTITTIRVGQLADAPLNLSDNIPHEVGTDLKRATIQELVDFVANAIEVGSGVGYLPLSVTDGQQLPEVPENPSFFLCGAGTFLNINGFPDIVCTENLNAIMSLSDHWEIAVQIPITFDTPGSIISQSITEGVTNFAPSEDAVFNFGETLEKLENKISEIVNYSEIDYPNEKAVHDALDMKLNISDLPSNLIFYATTAVADVSGYFKLVDNVEDVDYDEPAVDVSTGEITTTAQLISSLISAPGLLTGNPGVINITTVGNIKRISGTGAADFYFSAFHRDVAGVETLVGTSNNSETITNSVYEQFTTTLLWNNGDFIETDRIVLKFYANRIAGGGNPTYNFQFGGDAPVRTIIPVPFFIVAGDYELKANKQNSLTADLTNLKYPTVTAVNVGLATKQNTLTNPITGTGTVGVIAQFYSSGSIGNSAISQSADRILLGTSDNGVDKLQVNGSATVGNFKSTQILDNGTNIGIGTTTPDINSKLTILNPNNLTSIKSSLLLDAAYANSAGGQSIDFSVNASGYKEMRIAGVLDSAGGAGELAFYTNQYVTTTNGTEKMRIAGNGNVLIGTTTNNGVDRLQVNGSILATSIKKSGAVANQLLKADGGVTVGYKVYTALITQTGTNPPTAIVLENTLGGTPVWGRSAAGNYELLLTGAFTPNKTTVQVTHGETSYGLPYKTENYSTGGNQVYVYTFDTIGANLDLGFSDSSIEIRVYN